MDEESKKLVIDALEFAIRHESEDLLSELAEYQPPESVRWLMAEAAANVLDAFERGQVVGKESSEILAEGH
jgi:hypothetical protein